MAKTFGNDRSPAQGAKKTVDMVYKLAFGELTQEEVPDVFTAMGECIRKLAAQSGIPLVRVLGRLTSMLVSLEGMGVNGE